MYSRKLLLIVIILLCSEFVCSSETAAKAQTLCRSLLINLILVPGVSVFGFHIATPPESVSIFCIAQDCTEAWDAG